MQEYYDRQYHADSVYIPYGSESGYGKEDAIFDELKVMPEKYLLVVARLEPENNTDFVIEEFVGSRSSLPLIVVGDSPYGASYLNRLRNLGDTRVRFVGRINDQAKLNSLYRGAYLYIHAHEVGGTNPSLLRALDAGTAPLVLNVDFNVHVAADCCQVFEKSVGSLRDKLEELLSHPDEVAVMGQKARRRAETCFRWESVVAAHLDLFSKVSKA